LISGGVFVKSLAGQPSGRLINSYSALLVSYFIGSTAGHYYGKAISDRGTSVHSAYLGASTMLVIYWLVRVRLSPLTGALVFMTLALILAHGTDLIRRSKEIKQAIDYFAKGLSPLGILLFGVFEFLPPGVIEPAKVTSTIHRSLTQDVILLGASVNILVFGVGSLLGVLIILTVLGIILSEP